MSFINITPYENILYQQIPNRIYALYQIINNRKWKKLSVEMDGGKCLRIIPKFSLNDCRVRGGRIKAKGKSRTSLRPGQNPPRTTCFMASYIFACRGKKGETPPPPESDKKTLITLSYVTFLYLCATKVSRTHLFQANRFGGVCGWVVQWFGGSLGGWQ